MNKYLSMLVAFVVTLFTVNALAFSPPPAPARGLYVYDGTGKMTATQIGALNSKINRISQATHNEFGIAFLQSLDGETIEDAANSTFRAWGIGKHGLDNGVLIMLSLKEHKSRIETGKGVGGEITDVQAKQILDGLRPALRAGDFYGAFNKALDDTSALLDSRANAKQQLTPMVNPTPAQQQAANQLAQQQGAPQPYQQPSTPVVQQQSSGGMSGFAIFMLVLLGLGVVGAGVYFLVVLPNQRAEEERLRQEAADRQSRLEEEERARLERARLRREEQDRAEAARKAELERVRQQTYTPPPVRHTHHSVADTLSRASTRLTPSVPSTPVVAPPPPPVYVAPVAPPPAPVEDNSAALAAAAAAAALAAEQEEERRAERRRREREEERREEERRAEAQRRRDEEEEERRAEARQREREAEERRAEARRQEEEDRRRRDEESSSSSSSSSFDWGSSSSGSDSSGGGFGGGDSGGGGASSDW